MAKFEYFNKKRSGMGFNALIPISKKKKLLENESR